MAETKDLLPYKYKVNQRCLRTVLEFDKDGKVTRRHQAVFGAGQDYAIDAPQVSAALDPADDFTKAATEKRRKEIELERAAKTEAGPEVQALRLQTASMQKQLEDQRQAFEAQGKQIAELLAALKAKK